MKLLDQAIELCCAEAQYRHAHPKSVEKVRLALEWFAGYGEAIGLTDLREATATTLREFPAWLAKRRKPDGEALSVNYRNDLVTIVCRMFRLLAERGLILRDISAGYPPLRYRRSLPRGILNKEQMEALLHRPPLSAPLGFRDRAILELLYSTGLRGGELCRLTLYDLNREDRTLRVVQGKGRKDRVVPIGKAAGAYVEEYLRRIRPLLAKDDSPPNVFLSARGRVVDGDALRRIVRQYRDAAGLPRDVSVHSLRHTCATELLKGGASIRHVQELLGHADIQTTQIYTRVVPSELKKAHARSAPSERRRATGEVSFAGTGRVRWNDMNNSAGWRKFAARGSGKKTGQELKKEA